MSDLTAYNQRRWNENTAIHLRSAFYDVDRFKHGKSTLKSVELAELGDVRGKTLLHLQCHFGMDSLSWARLGATVTGVDFSDHAIDAARQLNDELGLDSAFICSDIYDVPQVITEQFDVVFTSYGVLCWFADLKKWAEIIAERLKLGGVFFIAEGHPLLNVYELDESGRLAPTYPYFSQEPIECSTDRSYADRDTPIDNTKTYQWDHTLGEVVSALASAGLRIDSLREYPFCAYEKFPGIMFEDSDGWWRFKENAFLPLLFSIRAVKE